jgi:hypothetical protein
MVGLMKTSSNALSTYRRDLARGGLDRWRKLLADNSKIVRKGGNLLASQLSLLDGIFRYFTKDRRPIFCVSAPPASGKTHVICLVSTDLATCGVTTAVVAPSGELRRDLIDGYRHIVSSPKSRLNLLTMKAFLKEREDYEVALLDEAHNIRSSFELNPEIYRVLDISDLSPLVHGIVHDNRQRGLAKVIDGEGKESLLKIAYSARGYKWLGDIYHSRSKWIVTISHSSKGTQLHLMLADPEKRMITAKSSTILISATQLDDNELEFYCGINPNDVSRLQLQTDTPSDSRCRYFAPRDRIDDEFAMALAQELLARRRVRALILVNRPDTFRKWLQRLRDSTLRTRVIGVVGGGGEALRLRRFSQFMSREDSILLTNSSVFWEGINIKQLGTLIITEQPNPRPTLVDVYNGRSMKFTHIIQNRMIQGMGRIGRTPNDDGLCLILFPYKDDRVSQFGCDSASVRKTISQILKPPDVFTRPLKDLAG